jgi:hypothetical protein
MGKASRFLREYWGLFAVVALAIPGVLAYLHIEKGCRRASTGTPAHVLVIPTDGGASLLVVDVVESGGDDSVKRELRVEAIDAATGEVTGERFFAGLGGCAPASVGRLWCTYGGLALYDARSLAEVIGVGAAFDRAELGHRVSGRWKLDGAEAWVLLEDGRAGVLDAATLEVRTVDSAPTGLDGKLTDAAQSTCAGVRQATVAGVPVTIGSGERAAIVRGAAKPQDGKGKGHKAGRAAEAPADAAAPTYLSPQLLVDPVAGGPLAVGADPVIVHTTSLERSRARQQVSRVDAGGAAVWTIALDGRCQLATTVGDALVFATDRPAQRVIAIAADTGEIRWRRSR